ncbi:MAG TPA: PRTRC system protein E, partial [Hanamia sp.]|nr:PRTRC system protein E [Hanamia sp.]
QEEIEPGAFKESGTTIRTILLKIKKPEKIRTCRICGCTDDKCIQCIKKTGSPCHWVEEDLCSACQEPEPEIEETPEERDKVLTEDDSPEEILKSIVKTHKQAEKHLSELQKMISPENNNDMNFFQQLFEKIDGIDLSLNIKRKNGKITLSVLPQTAGTISPALITGTPEELDAGFFEAVKAPIAEAKGLSVDLNNLQESIKEAKAKKEADLKEAAKNAKPAAPPAKKSNEAAKKPAKKIEKAKEKPVKDETPKASIPDLFANV